MEFNMWLLTSKNLANTYKETKKRFKELPNDSQKKLMLEYKSKIANGIPERGNENELTSMMDFYMWLFTVKKLALSYSKSILKYDTLPFNEKLELINEYENRE